MDVNKRTVITEQELSSYKKEISFLSQLQYAIKIIINSIYGAFGNKYFYFHNKDIAQSITKQGKHLILFSIAAVNNYFIKIWHTDKELHEKLGISHLKINPIVADSAIYADTDSVYTNFSHAINSIEGLELTDKEKIEFCKKIVDYRFDDYLKNAFEAYAQAYGVKNYMSFKLERISYNGVWVAKKNYSINIGWDGYFLDKVKNLTKGLEAVKPSHPSFARDILKDFIQLILLNKGKISVERDIIPKLKKYRAEIELKDINDISYVQYVKSFDDYNKDVVFESYDMSEKTLSKLNNLPKGTPINTRAAIYYNFFRNVSKSYKYYQIKQGDKVRIYYAKSDQNPEWNIFAFHPRQFPMEFALPIDYDMHFFKTIVEPINRILKVIGYHSITSDLTIDVPIKLKVTKSNANKSVNKVYVVNGKTLEHIIAPETLNDLLLKKRNPETNEIPIYESYIYKYGIDTEIVPDYYYDDYLKSKNKEHIRIELKEWLENLNNKKVEYFNEAYKILKNDKYKKQINFDTKKIEIRRSFSKVTLVIDEKFINSFRGVNDAVVKIQTYFIEHEPESNKETMAKKYIDYGKVSQ